LHREFFYATPGEVRAVLMRLDRSKHISFNYTEAPEALEYRQSAVARKADRRDSTGTDR
jgi:hypothetical protein